ncbi:MAG: di-trans,poly-cis-decaprenylcistransferase [Parcubacteria group bacterium]|nr:di-trans,poly-cis-decaprenylcistransferase [Parcubacteria group bacterium]
MITKPPQCIGIILDGNRRWAKGKGLPSLEGHRQGAERLRDTARLVRDRGIRHLAVYAFSTENWNRDEKEVSYLMGLFRDIVETHFAELAKEGIRIRFVGQRDRFASDMQELMARVEKDSESNESLTLWVCFSYGGRAEIAAAAQTISGDITEESIATHLWTAGMPDPDIVIRTGGEKRLSGFLTWQSIYSELFFVDEYWPDFSEAILDSILSEYAQRERRHGK